MNVYPLSIHHVLFITHHYLKSSKMKKSIVILVSFIFMSASCHKSTMDNTSTDCYISVNLQLSANDVFIFGSSGGFGGAGQGTFKIKNGQLFSVSTKGDSLLPNSKFLIANAFTTAFPKEMKDVPNQNWRSQCNDTFIYAIEWTAADGTKKTWYYDYCPSQSAPAYAQCYFKEVIKAVFTP